MNDPVTLESGRTYERIAINQYFATQLETAKRMIDGADSDLSEERDMTTADFITCPITMQKVDASIMIPNKAIKRATEIFLDENPWAFEFDPWQNFMSIKL